MGSHTNWSQALSVGVCTAMSSKKVIACETAPLSLLLNTALGCNSQQNLVQLAAGSTPVSSQNALTRGETAISHAFPFGHLHHRPDMASPTLCKMQEYTLNHSVLSTSPRTAAVDQVQPTPGPLKMTMNPTVGQSPPMLKRMLPMTMNMLRFVRVMVNFWAMARWPLMARMAQVAPQHRTPTWVLVTSLAPMRRPMGSLFMRRGHHLRGRSGTIPVLLRKRLPMSPKSRPPARKNSRLTRPCMTGAGSGPGIWTLTSMPGGARISPKAFLAGPLEIP